MHIGSLALPVALLSSHALAFPQLDKRQYLDAHDDPYPFLGVPLNGIRSPCPAHNTLANHGFIPRDGRGITKEIITSAVSKVFNIGPETVGPVADRALALCSFLTQSVCSSYDLDHLRTPHTIEHEGSLTRGDYMMPWSTHADNFNFNATIFSRTQRAWGRGKTHIDIIDANTARVARLEESARDDLKGWYIRNDAVTATENAFILFAMNDHFVNPDLTKPLARKEWVEYWFEQERLPTDLGFVRQSTFPGTAYITNLASAVLSATTRPVGAGPSTSGGSVSASTTLVSGSGRGVAASTTLTTLTTVATAVPTATVSMA